ncbi:hypothetical protein BLA60_11170 [Actinophytocola xinjiangensis]|uniref:PH (Pleckstrin Homology) domain-containing protein n=1 Tax=Actinophytocola xinjiangensis TaxID=485602 RepID=A0A7Z1AYC1_9PSEU|nr:hypothetical protein [Actinophytocola xinjiangensis]OLF11521.1 hypothetical protein BLA60_11170 [Actinophytocola xinjiangensis]
MRIGTVTAAAVRVARSQAALWHWVRRRRVGVGARDVAIGHARERTPMLLALAGVLTLETAVVGMLVPWPVVHVLDLVALLQVVGIAAVGVTYPHVVGGGELVVRDGVSFAFRVPLELVVSVRVSGRSHTGRARHVTDGELVVAVDNRTDVVVCLAEPVAGVERVRFRADDPAQAVSAIAAAVPNRA